MEHYLNNDRECCMNARAGTPTPEATREPIPTVVQMSDELIKRVLEIGGAAAGITEPIIGETIELQNAPDGSLPNRMHWAFASLYRIENALRRAGEFLR